MRRTLVISAALVLILASFAAGVNATAGVLGPYGAWADAPRELAAQLHIPAFREAYGLDAATLRQRSVGAGAVMVAIKDSDNPPDAGTGDLSYVYYSSSAPYKNDPPEFALNRWTMSDVLRWHWFSREQAVALTYSFWICGTLQALSADIEEGAGPAELETRARLIREWIAAAERRCRALSDAEGWQPLSRLETLLDEWDFSGAAPVGWKARLDAVQTAVSRSVHVLEGMYRSAMDAYRSEVRQPEACGRDYSTHCEIMYLYEMWKSSDLYRTFRQALRGLLGTMADPPRALIISKPMCENCEKNIVRAWTGVDKDLYVVTERKPNSGEKLRHDPASRVKKIDSPLDGRESYVPTA